MLKEKLPGRGPSRSFGLFNSGCPRLVVSLFTYMHIISTELTLLLLDSDLIAPRYDRRQAELYTIKLVFEWLPNCEPNDERALELDELPDNSAIFAIRYLHSSLVQDPPGISAQFGEPVPTNADNVRSAFPKTVSRINTFRFDEINKRDTVKFIFNYKPEGKHSHIES